MYILNFDAKRKKTLTFLTTAVLVLCATSSEANEQNSPKYRVLFFNDTTNMLGRKSPYHKAGEPFGQSVIYGAVDETANAGVDVHLLEPAHCWAPWWKSRTVSLASRIQTQDEWFKNTYSIISNNSYHDYMKAGGDIIQDFIDRCGQKRLVPFVSFRLNDSQSFSRLYNPNCYQSMTFIKFYYDNPQYRLGSDINDRTQSAQNWAIPEVRQHKFQMIQDICENYSIKGLNLDFMRGPAFFNKNETTHQERQKHMTNFVSQVREVLDRTSASGERRFLSIRVPCTIVAFDMLGIDLAAMVTAGVDMIILSPSYCTYQQNDLGIVRNIVPNTPLYLEMTCYSNMACNNKNVRVHRRTTDEQFYTGAHLAYAHGVDGIALFNFVYYREGGALKPTSKKVHEAACGTFNEPPFHIIQHLKDPNWLSQQPQHYVIINSGYAYGPVRPLPKHFVVSKPSTFELDMVPPKGGWQIGGKLRIQTCSTMDGTSWSVQLNNQELVANTDVSEPYPSPYKAGIGKPNQYRAWTIPKNILINGRNVLKIVLKNGNNTRIQFIDLAVE